MKKIAKIFAIMIAFSSSIAFAASGLTINVKLASGVDGVNGISSSGKVFGGKVSGSKVKITIPKSSISGSSLYATYQGKFLGPVLSPDSNKGRFVLVKSPVNAKKKKISTLSLALKTPSSSNNFVMLKSAPKGEVFNKKYKCTPSNIQALGLNIASSQSTLNRPSVRASASNDTDGDCVVNDLDADIDGDGITNIADSSTTSSSVIGVQSTSGANVPFTTLYLSMPDTLNWHIGGSLSSSAIDAVIGGENQFAAAFFFSLGGSDTTSITGGHIVCSSSLVYCGGDSGIGVYSGFSDGDQTLPGRLWSSITTDGSPYSLERMYIEGGSGDEITLAASVQPRIGTSGFAPGDNYRADFTDSSGTVLTSHTLVLPPYFLTVPAIKSYNTTSDSTSSDQSADYSGGTPVGGNQSNPIVLASTGDFTGKLRLVFSRLQRLSVRPTEDGGDYRDFGRLNYGVIISNNSGEFTCGGLYTNLSSTLTEGSYLGSTGGFSSQDGATLWPLVDSSDDYEPSSASDATTVAANTLAFTVDLKSCLARNGLTAGTHLVTLTAAGSDTGHGANRAGQNFYVTIP